MTRFSLNSAFSQDPLQGLRTDGGPHLQGLQVRGSGDSRESAFLTCSSSRVVLMLLVGGLCFENHCLKYRINSAIITQGHWNLLYLTLRMQEKGFPCGAVVKYLPANAGDAGDGGSILGSGRSPGRGNGNLLQCSCLEDPMDRGAWRATVHEVTKSQTRLSAHTHTNTHTCKKNRNFTVDLSFWGGTPIKKGFAFYF